MECRSRKRRSRESGSELTGGFAVRLESVETRQLVEQPAGQRREPVVVERQLLKEEQLAEDGHGQRPQQVAVQAECFQKVQLVEEAAGERCQEIVGQVQGFEPVKSCKIPSPEAAETLIAQVQGRDVPQIPLRDLRTSRGTARRYEGVPHLQGPVADPTFLRQQRRR